MTFAYDIIHIHSPDIDNFLSLSFPFTFNLSVSFLESWSLTSWSNDLYPSLVQRGNLRIYLFFSSSLKTQLRYFTYISSFINSHSTTPRLLLLLSDAEVQINEAEFIHHDTQSY